MTMFVGWKAVARGSAQSDVSGVRLVFRHVQTLIRVGGGRQVI